MDRKGQAFLAGPLKEIGRVPLGQGQKAQTAPEGLLGVAPGGEDPRDDLPGGRPDLRGPGEEALRVPAVHSLVGLGHMRGQGGVSAGRGVLSMAGHPLALVEDLHDGVGDAEADLLVDQGVGHRVKVAVHLHVIVDMDLGLLPAGQLVAVGGKRRKSGFFLGEEELLSRPGPASLEGTAVEIVQQTPDRLVQRDEVEEGPRPEPGQDPAGDQLDRLLCGSLVLWTFDTRWKNRRRIMLRHLPVGLVGEGLVEIGGGDAALEVIGDQEGGNASQKLEATDMGADPGGQILAWGGLGEHVVREPEGGDEDLGFRCHLPGPGILDRDGGAGIVDEEPVPRGVGVPVGGLQALGIGGVMDTEAGVGISPLFAPLPILFPEEQKGDAFMALKFPMNLIPVREGPGRRRGSFLLFQNLRQKRLAAGIGQGPGNGLELPEVFGNRGCGQGQALGNGSSRHVHLA